MGGGWLWTVAGGPEGAERLCSLGVETLSGTAVDSQDTWHVQCRTVGGRLTTDHGRSVK